MYSFTLVVLLVWKFALSKEDFLSYFLTRSNLWESPRQSRGFTSINYQEPSKCTFHVESHKAEGAKIPEAIDEHIRSNLFIPEDFDALVLAAADNNESVGKLLRELQEPRPSGASCIPWLGELLMKERVIRICTRGDIAINLRGMEYLQLRADEDEEDAWKRMRGKLGTGKHLDETYVLRPQAVPHTEGVSKPAPEPEPDGGLFGRSTGNDEQATGNEEGGMGGTSPTPPDGGGSIFGGGSDLIPHATGATSALNLLGKVESWGIATGSQVQDMSLKVSSLTGAQLNKLLRGLPDGITYELSLNKEKK